MGDGEHAPCPLCDGTGYLDHAGYRLDLCGHAGAHPAYLAEAGISA